MQRRPCSLSVPRRETKRSLAAVALLLLAAACATGDSRDTGTSTQPLATSTALVSETFHGGVVSDGWATISLPNAYTSGVLNVQLPPGATVRKAWLNSTVNLGPVAAGTAMPAGAAGFPRSVILGPGAIPTRNYDNVVPDFGGVSGNFFGSYVTDVTAIVTTAIGTSNGAVVAIPIKEQGDATSSDVSGFHYPEILGHTIIVTYNLASAPLRNVAVSVGAIPGTGGGVLNFASPVANNCPAGNAAAEALVGAVADSWDYDNAEEGQSVTINGTVLSARLGGSDDWDIEGAPAYGGYPRWSGDSRTAALYTSGSFGAGAGGKPATLAAKNDLLSGVAGPRLDDELYNFQPYIANGATSATVTFNGSGSQSFNMTLIQTPAQVAPGDSDGDGVTDVTEGNCTVDTDADGIPDYLDVDSDNDCLKDGDAAEAGAARTNAALPAGGHCAATFTCKVDGAVGSCFAPNGTAPTSGSCQPTGLGTSGTAYYCTSGVCSTTDGLCGEKGGEGPCTAANQATICRTKGCNVVVAPAVCFATFCGNGVLEAGEGCDDGNTVAGDACDGSCKVETTFACGNNAAGATGNASCASGICDTAGNAAPGKCEAVGACGNSVREANEGCDDGNLTAGDGCDATCKVENTFACNGAAPGFLGNASCASAVCDATGNAAPGKCEPAATCGNGVLDAVEGCDDGNTAAGDGCDDACKVENAHSCNQTAPGKVGGASCASGVCNTIAFPGTGQCQAAGGCGNSVLDATEGCDDGNVANSDGCDSNCKVENGVSCNQSAPGKTGAASCQSGLCNVTAGGAGVCNALNHCGNSVLEAGEGCDDGANTNGDGCTTACKIELAFACNANNAGAVGASSCASGLCDAKGNADPGVCEAVGVCGNGILDAAEGCDDGNTVAGDGCNATCAAENGAACNPGPAGQQGNASCASGLCSVGIFAAPGKCVAVGACGNGILDATEGCDDGNTDADDGCSAACKIETSHPCNLTAPGLASAASCSSGVCNATAGAPGICQAANVCGNSVVDAAEGCDDGNVVAGDGCSATCLREVSASCNGSAPGLLGAASCASHVCNTAGGGVGVCAPASGCGNSVLEATEGCDDGNSVANDGCDGTCKRETGGGCNGTLPGLLSNPSCASGICNTTAGLPGICSAALVCGNGVLEVGEGCDDGNTTANDGCNSGCALEDGKACNANGAGVTGSGSCASGICNVTAGAPGLCNAANRCGNSVLEAGEGCDDGNALANDGCDASCHSEIGAKCNQTAPGVLGDVSCSSGVCNLAAGAPGICNAALLCGNGRLEAGEGCDDGNTVANDGCSPTCLIDVGQSCNGAAPGTMGAASCTSGVCNTKGFAAPGQCQAQDRCGNGVLEAGEGCDDGNLTGGDSCSAACKIETGASCNTVAPGTLGALSCVTGICNTAQGAPGVCSLSLTCGNGKLEVGEGCDDGNKAAGDGCDAVCTIEQGGACNANAAGVTGGGSCQSGICNTLGAPAPGLCNAALVCGNGALEAGEGCDDGNTASNDGCDSSCLAEIGAPCNGGATGLGGDLGCASGVCNNAAGNPGKCARLGDCGNGHLEPGEGCDDGNVNANDGCTSTCRLEAGRSCNTAAPGLVGDASCFDGLCNLAGGIPGVCQGAGQCGNGRVETDEGCDDGNALSGDGCDAACAIETGKSCNQTPPGNQGAASCASGVCNTSGGMPGTCSPGGACGNGVLEPGEGCDDGNTTSKDGCRADCKREEGQSCGPTGAASCASGLCNTTTGTPGLCAPTLTCGNGHLEGGEGCDDGNARDGDGCDSRCKIEAGGPCGAGGGISCASGYCNQVAGEPGTCATTLSCGNGVVDPGEGCDDGNARDRDGCDASCHLETGASCTEGTASSCASGYCWPGGNICADNPSAHGALGGGGTGCAVSTEGSANGAAWFAASLAASAFAGRRRRRQAA